MLTTPDTHTTHTTDTTPALAVRLFDNQKYGTAYGKGVYRRALYNGTVDIKQPQAKYLIDLFSYQDWMNQARTDQQMAAIDSVHEDKDALFSWIQRYDPKSKSKTLVSGVCVFSLAKMSLQMVIQDDASDLCNHWQLDVRHCRQAATNQSSPQLLATNTDLEVFK
jgi:hypothetical protein